MKKIFLGAFLLGMMLIFMSIEKAPYYSIEDVVSAVKAGNAAQMAKYFDDRLDLSIPGRSDNYSRTQAEMILKDFFKNFHVKDFVVKHRGLSEGAEYCFGDLQTGQGNFRVSLYMKNKGDHQVVQEIGVEKSD